MKRKRRLLYVTTVRATLESFLLPYVEHYRGFGWEVDVMANGASSSSRLRSTACRAIDASWTRNPLQLRSQINGFSEARRAIARGNYDIVHVHTPIASFLTRAAIAALPRQARPRVAYTAHGLHIHDAASMMENAAIGVLESAVSTVTDVICVINDEDYRTAVAHRLGGRVAYIPGVGVDAAYYSREEWAHEPIAEAYASAGCSPSEIVFACVAEFSSNKRQADVVRALAMVNDPRVVCVFAGDGRELSSVARLATRLGVAKRARFVGHVNWVPRLLRISRASILYSRREGLPRSVMESLLMEVPVIGSSVRGIRQLIDDSCGYVVSGRSVCELADAMARAAKSPVEARIRGKRGRARIASQFGLSTVLSVHDKLYRDLLCQVG